MKPLVCIAVLAAACHREAPAISGEDRDRAVLAAKQCTDTVDSLAPSYQMVGPQLAAALKMNRGEAQRLMRDSVELLISTREMLCNISSATVDSVLEKAPHEQQILAAQARTKAALARLADVRTAYDKLLGAATSADVPVDQDALLQRFSNALLGH